MIQPLAIDRAELKPCHLVIGEDIDPSQWERMGRALILTADQLQWWLGDWMSYGHRAWGRSPESVSHIIGVPATALREYQQVAECVPAVRRYAQGELWPEQWWSLPMLSWAHHREVMDLQPDKQTTWLRWAWEDNWTVSELRQRINEQERGLVKREVARVFSIASWCQEFRRWWRREQQSKPYDQWTTASRSALKRELTPVVEVWRLLLW